MKQFSRRARGFTLIEILVVLAIAALLASILFAAFKSVSEGNKKSSCQNNLVQIYQATRLYAQDFNGELPYYNPDVLTTDTAKAPLNGLGLWALYAYPISDNVDCDGVTSELPSPTNSTDNVAPLASYIKTPRFFHCPYDSFARDALQTPSRDGCAATASSKLQSDVMQYTQGGTTYFNPYYLSYQVGENPTADGASNPYSSFRTADSKRQLIYYKTDASDINRSVRISDTTIITWCRFHRSLDANGNTIDKASNFDNVLFADGTVQYIPTKQTLGSDICEGWQRLPLELASNATACPTN